MVDTRDRRSIRFLFHGESRRLGCLAREEYDFGEALAILKTSLITLRWRSQDLLRLAVCNGSYDLVASNLDPAKLLWLLLLPSSKKAADGIIHCLATQL